MSLKRATWPCAACARPLNRRYFGGHPRYCLRRECVEMRERIAFIRRQNRLALRRAGA